MAAQVGNFLSRISTISNQIVLCLETPFPSHQNLENLCSRMRMSLRQLGRLQAGLQIPNAQYQELQDGIKLLLKEAEDELCKAQPAAREASYRVETIQGRRGAPRYNITGDQLKTLLDAHFTITEIGRLLQVSVSTIERRMGTYNLHRPAYSNITDGELDDLIRPLVANRSLGYRAVHTALRNQGHLLTYERVRVSMLRVDAVGVALRWGRTIHRRSYSVAAPNALWHIDGNHKLIRWKMVIHGGIDGYSRHIVFLRISDNNRSSTVFNAFLGATIKFGVPSRVRADHGGENVDVACFMVVHSGLGRGSIITGASTHNQRVERFWRDLFSGLTGTFYELFRSLEENGQLDPSNEQHMYALHYVFLPVIQDQINTFAENFNNHPLRTENNHSPRQLFISGTLGNYHNVTTRSSIFSGTTPAQVTRQHGLNDIVESSQDNPPTIPCPLSPEQLTLLKARIHPVDDSRGNNGRDVYMRTVEEIYALMG